MKPTRNIPTVLVVFGATGDLMARKVVPALYHLYEHHEIPSMFSVIGVSRQRLSDASFRKLVANSVGKHLKKSSLLPAESEFLKLFSFHHGVFERLDDYKSLQGKLSVIDDRWRVCSNKLFYLAVPPQYYQTIFKHLAKSELTKPCSPEEGWTRVLVEKPFGKDLRTAEQLDTMLGKLFKEIQIYRIDHYLAKEMLQGIISFRFSNNLLEASWNSRSIEKIDIYLNERIGAEDRGSFYDGVGAFRDVGQNHLLQMLSLITMDHPLNNTADVIRSKRAEILRSLEPLSRPEIKEQTFRAQYLSYQKIPGVSNGSKTETYFKVKARLNQSRWAAVPITLQGGKRIKDLRKEIVVTFKHPVPCLCPPDKHFQNRVIFTLEPTESIKIEFFTKKPGFEPTIEEREFNFFLYEKREKVQYVEEYAKLLVDAFAGDQTLFISTDELKAMWRFTDPITKAWEEDAVPLATYRPDTNEAPEQAAYIDGERPSSQREVGMVGLGKMGSNLTLQLLEKGYRVVGYNRTLGPARDLANRGMAVAGSMKSLVEELKPPRVIWLMVPAGSPVDQVLAELLKHLKRGDIVIDGGNSYYKDSITRSRKMARRGIKFVDVGVSGGPQGARYGASLMVGGDKQTYRQIESLLIDLAAPQGVQFFDGSGAGHFVKMIHNGIEYGMMQAIAEGFTILKKAGFKLDLSKVATVYDHGSVIESRLVGWLKDAFELHGEELRKVSGTVAHTGEGEWTVETAQSLKLKAQIIEGALKFRKQSKRNPSYTGKIVSALREQFGGHSIAT